MRIAPLFAVIALAATPVVAPAAAHEFWISPKDYTVGPQDQLVASIRVGQEFEGIANPYLPPRFERFDLVFGNEVLPVEGRIGDRPAMQMAAPGEGLIVLVHQTKDSKLTYKEWEKFVAFATHKDFTWALERHAERGLPETGFREVYSRYGKSLMAVGHGAGADKPVGLLTEIVALANPYTDDLDDGLPVRVLYDGAPRALTQVEVFERGPDRSVEVKTYRTDDKGEAIVPVKPGYEYLVDSVVMRPVEPSGAGSPVWETLWASLTFFVPAE